MNKHRGAAIITFQVPLISMCCRDAVPASHFAATNTPYVDNHYKSATATRTAAKNTVYIHIEKYSPGNQQFGESD